jgi:hypothetical protein
MKAMLPALFWTALPNSSNSTVAPPARVVSISAHAIAASTRRRTTKIPAGLRATSERGAERDVAVGVERRALKLANCPPQVGAGRPGGPPERRSRDALEDAAPGPALSRAAKAIVPAALTDGVLGFAKMPPPGAA